jgi:hypothetical protein
MKKIMYVLLCAGSLWFAACESADEDFAAEGAQSGEQRSLSALAESTNALTLTCAPITNAGISSTYNNYFTRGNPSTDSWTGGDATYSIPLGSGKILWMFGDSFVGRSNSPNASHPYRWRPRTEGMPPNTFMIQNTSVTPNTWITVTGGLDFTTFKYRPVVKTGLEDRTDETREWYWPGDATIRNGTLYMFFHRYRKSGSFWISLRTDLCTFSVAALKGLSQPLSTIAPQSTTLYYNVPNPSTPGRETLFAGSLMEDGTNDYIYIADKVSGWHHAKVLMVAQSAINGAKFYFTGYGSAPNYTPTWGITFPGPGSTTGNMKKLSNGVLSDLVVSPQFSVVKIGTKYRLVTQEELGTKIYSYESSSPVGPWQCQSTIYTITDPNTMPVTTYNAYLHPEIRNGSQYLISYNLNATNPFWDLWDRIDTYRPKFIWVNIP